MNALAVKFTDTEKMDVGNELRRLFNFLDKPLPEDKKASMVIEIENFGYPFKAVVEGIRALCDKDMRSIRLFDLKEAIRGFVTYDAVFQECQYCGTEGVVRMRFEEGKLTGYVVTVACVCGRGDNIAEVQKLTQWNGRADQNIRGDMCHLVLSTYIPDLKALTAVVEDTDVKDACAEVGGEVVRTGGGR